MRKVFSFTTNVMNGTVTCDVIVAFFSTRELAEQTLQDVKARNDGLDLGGLSITYGKIMESDVYETKDEIPFYQTEEG